MNGDGSIYGGWNLYHARMFCIPRGMCELEKRRDGKNDNNKSEARNNNRESAPGTRPKGKNVRPSVGGEIVFLASGCCCAS